MARAASKPPAVPLPSAPAVLTWCRCRWLTQILGYAGFFYTLDLIFNFHVGFIGKYNTQKTLVMDGRAIARYYVTKGTFVVDFITTCCWLAQVSATLSTSVKRPCSRLPWACASRDLIQCSYLQHPELMTSKVRYT